MLLFMSLKYFRTQCSPPCLQVVTANCVPIQSADNVASNGVVHVVASRLPDTTSSIYDIVANDERFSTLKLGTLVLFSPVKA